MKEYRSTAAIKTAARVHMFGRYGVTVRAYIWMNAILLIMTWLFASMNSQGAGSLISVYIFYAIRFIILGIFMSGTAYLYLNIASEQPAYAGMVFYGFRNHTDKAVMISLVIDAAQLVLCIPLLVFFYIFKATGNQVYLIPFGIGALIALAGLVVCKALFMPAYYLIHDFPDYGVAQIIRLCPTIMRGHMGRAMYLYIGFIPMMLLELVSLGAAAPWVESYLNASFTEMYLDIMKKG